MLEAHCMKGAILCFVVLLATSLVAANPAQAIDPREFPALGLETNACIGMIPVLGTVCIGTPPVGPVSPPAP